MSYKDYYKPELIQDMFELTVVHLINKHERASGIIALLRDGAYSYYPVSDKNVLEGSMDYFNKQIHSKAHWFYMKDLKKHYEELLSSAARQNPETVLHDRGTGRAVKR